MDERGGGGGGGVAWDPPDCVSVRGCPAVVHLRFAQYTLGIHFFHTLGQKHTILNRLPQVLDLSRLGLRLQGAVAHPLTLGCDRVTVTPVTL